MLVKRKYYSNPGKEKNDLEVVANKGIVGGIGTTLLGGLSILSSSELKKLGLNGKKVKQLGNIGKILVPTGSGIAIYGGYLKHKSKKKEKDDNKA
jgi:hypothetical protein